MKKRLKGKGIIPFCSIFLLLLSFFSTTKLLADPVDSLIIELNNSSGEQKKAVLVKLAYIEVNSEEDSLSIPEQGVEAQIAESEDLAVFYEQIGIIYFTNKKFDKAYAYLQKALAIFRNKGDDIGIGRAKQALGLLYAELSDFEEAINQFMDVIRIFKERDELVLEADAITCLAEIFVELKQYQEANDLFLEAGKTWEELRDTFRLADAKFYLANIKNYEKKADSALIILEQTVALQEAIENKKGLADAYFAIASIYENKDEFISADSYYHKALTIYKKLSYRYGEAKTLNALGKYYLSIDELNNARVHFNEAMILAEYIGSGKLLVEIYKNLSVIYEKENRYNLAMQYYKSHTELKDSLFSEKKYHKIAEIKLSLDNKRKSKTIQQLEEDSRLKQKLLQQQRNALIASALAVVMFVVIVVIVFKQNRRRKQRNKELKSQKDKAEEADRLKSAFLANMSHEIRSPMNAIIGFSDLIKDSFKLEEEVEQYIGFIKQSGSNLVQLVDDIIDIAKIEAGQLKIRKAEFDLNDMLNNLLASVQAGYEKSKSKKVSIHLNIPDGITPVIVSDELRIRQVLNNFISNAIKFTEKGYIEFGYEKAPGGQLLFYTKDSGIGISEKDKELVFQRFGQVEETYTRNTSGTGLGLAISKSIVELIGGEIWFDSTEGKGTTFFFKIPVDYAKSKLVAPPLQKNQIKNFNWEDKLILVVEDDDMNFKVASSILKKTKAQLIRAENGAEAVQIALSNKHISLILMDIQLPKMNGYDASAKIKEQLDIPIIAVSAYAMPGEKEKSLQAGCNGFINKPYNTYELLSKMSMLIR